MCVKVLLADDAEIVRRAILNLLGDCKDIEVVGEASNFHEALRKAEELQPDEILFDLHLADGESEPLPTGPKVVAMSFAVDHESRLLAQSLGATKLLDKMELAHELIPTILKVAEERGLAAS